MPNKRGNIMTQQIKYKEYEYCMARIAWWLVNNNKQFKKREKYNGVERETVEAQIRKGQGKIQNNNINEYVECAVIDNSDHSFLPNYVTNPNGEKYDKPIYIDMCKRVYEYERTNKKSPLIVYINTSQSNTSNTTTSNKNIYTQKPVLTSNGCSGMGQCTPYYCACNSVQQAIYKLTGKQVSESTLASVMGTTTSGTGHDGINTSIAWFNRKYGYNLKIEWKNFNGFGSTNTARFKAIGELMANPNKAVFCHLLYRNQYGHYEMPYEVNTSTGNLKILNSLGNRCNSPAYCGYIETRSFSTQASYLAGISQPSICIITKG